MGTDEQGQGLLQAGAIWMCTYNSTLYSYNGNDVMYPEFVRSSKYSVQIVKNCTE